MAGRYRRTISFPDPDPCRPSKPSPKSYHVRSTSLPCARSLPFIPQLRDGLAELRSWRKSRPVNNSLSWLLAGFVKLKSVLDSLDDVLQMPQTQDSLSQRTHLVEKLLEDFIRFVDVFGIFQTSMLEIKQEISAAQVAIRRKDGSKLSTCVKSQKEIAKEMAKLVSAVRSIDLPLAGADQTYDAEGEVEIPSIIRDAQRLTGAVSAALFEEVLRSLGPTRRRPSMSSSSWPAAFGFSKKAKKEVAAVEDGAGSTWPEFLLHGDGAETTLWGLMRKNINGVLKEDEEKRTGLLKKMEEIEECVSGMEIGSERVFRSLISTRVSLLNVLTHA